jgi:multisubunit Na+/H+ antiporter MnhB subunit
MARLVLESAAILVIWVAAGIVNNLWYRRIETRDSQLPEREMLLLLGPVGLCMLIICVSALGLVRLYNSILRRLH